MKSIKCLFILFTSWWQVRWQSKKTKSDMPISLESGRLFKTHSSLCEKKGDICLPAWKKLQKVTKNRWVGMF